MKGDDTSVPVSKDDFEALKHIYDYFKNKAFSIAEFCHQPVCTIILQEMHSDSQLDRTLRFNTPLPEIHALILSEMMNNGIHPNTPSGWLFEHYFSSEYNRADVLRQFVFGYNTIEAIATVYPIPFAFSDDVIFPIVPALDDGMLQGIITAWKSINNECETLEANIDSFKIKKENEILRLEKKKAGLLEQIEFLNKSADTSDSIATDSSEVNDTNQEIPNTEDCSSSSVTGNEESENTIQLSSQSVEPNTSDAKGSKPKKAKKKENHKSKINSLQKQVDEIEQAICSIREEINTFTAPREATIIGLRKALKSRENLVQYISHKKSCIEIERGEIRGRLYGQLTGYVEPVSPITNLYHEQNNRDIRNKCVAFAHRHKVGLCPGDEETDVYDLYCDILEYAEANQATEHYLPELEVFWGIQRKPDEWNDILLNLSRSDQSRNNRALFILFMNSEDERNRKTLIRLIEERYMSLKGSVEIAGFISTLMSLEGNLKRKEALLQRLIKLSQDEQIKERKLSITKGAAIARDRFFNQTYQAIRALEEYAWNQETRDKKLFETIVALRTSMKYIGIDTVVDPQLWIDQISVPFRPDIHYIDGSIIPDYVKLRTMGFRFRKEDGKEEIERARVYIPRSDGNAGFVDDKIKNGESL